MAHPIPPLKDMNVDVRPLDAVACAALGHVVHIDERDAARGIAAMFRAMAAPPTNAALWTDACADMDSDMLRRLRAWRDARDFTNFIRLPQRMETYAQARLRLTAVFNAHAAQRMRADERATLRQLHDHMQGRIDAFEKAIPAGRIGIQIRAHGQTPPGGLSKPHIDGHNNPDAPRVLRFLEPLASDGTLVFANDDVAAEREDKARPIAGFGKRRIWRKTGLYAPAGLTAWQAPANSLLAISNDLHHSKPVLHSEPPAVTGRTESTRRLLLCYDIALGGSWHRAQPKPPV